MIERKTWYMIAFFLIGVAGAVWLNSAGNQLTAEPTATPRPAPLWQLAPEAVREIEVSSPQADVTVRARRAEDVGWELLSPELEGQSADAGRLERAVTALLAPRPVDVLEDVELDDFGLATPAHRVILTLQDGSTRELSIGSTAPTGDVTYATVPGSQAVFLLPAS
ncbi:MAG: DUF4340 domain-containing protein, partial [Anaerolineales bacterium]|nr:DUF4340 domain-containing protein [Anaerolineales bacterium]